MVVEEVIARSLLLLRRILVSTESVVAIVVAVVAVGCCECMRWWADVTSHSSKFF
jgi:hypothetical protein